MTFFDNNLYTSINKKARNTNVYNQFKCPKLMGNPGTLKTQNVVESVVDNATNYIVAYPFSGYNPDYELGDIKSNGFYNGRDQAIGSNFYIPLGRCSDDSEDGCAKQRRWVYIRNIPTGKIPLMGDISFKDITGCNMEGLTEGRGLLGGILEDISDIEPLSVLEAINGNGNYGSYKCKKVTYPVGSAIYDPKMEGKKWMMETKCSPSFHHLKNTTSAFMDKKLPGSVNPFGAGEKNETYVDYNNEKQQKNEYLYLLPFGCVLLYLIKNMLLSK